MENVKSNRKKPTGNKEKKCWLVFAMMLILIKTILCRYGYSQRLVIIFFLFFFFLPNIVIECVKRVQYVNNVSKKTCFGCFGIEEDMKNTI